MDKSSRGLIISDSDRAVLAMGPELDDAVEYARASKSRATQRAYRSDFEIFRTWYERKGLSPLPARAESVAAFLASEAKRPIKSSTIERRLAAIRFAHKATGHSSPATAEAWKVTLRGIKRSSKNAPCRKAPATSDKIAAMAAAAEKNVRGLRDRALLLLGFGGAFRRSELVALDISDLEFCSGGLRITIRRSKTDQEGNGATIAIAAGSFACPVKATRAWLTFQDMDRQTSFFAKKLVFEDQPALIQRVRGSSPCMPMKSII
jgi:site-specific recombinase XerC